MKIKTNSMIGKSYREFSLKKNIFIYGSVLYFFGIVLSACSDFVEVDMPKNLLISETVFEDPATVESALASLFYGMREQGMVSGNSGLTTALGIYSDELDYYGTNVDYAQLFNHNILPSNNRILDWWNQGYRLIYSANDIIKGVENSNALNTEEKNRFLGQALFVRAYIHSLLVSLYGDVPYITTTNYIVNNKAIRVPEEIVFDNIIADLSVARDVMENEPAISGERILPDKWVAKALLSRMYLYRKKWELAASSATELITTFNLETDVNAVFLKGSSETIWQLKADEDFPKNTREAVQLIIQAVPGQNYALTNDLLAAFEEDDFRKTNWIDSISNSEGTITLYYAHKYKAFLSETQSVEYSILFRLAEQFLIRAESRAHLGDIDGSRSDLNTIRNRSGLPNSTSITVNDLLDDILGERRVELFTEQGLRWFDLKRTGRANQVLGNLKQNWRITNIDLPVPEAELELNPNLLPQNEGY